MTNDKTLSVVVKSPALEHLRGRLVLIVTATAVELATVRERLTALPDGHLYKTSVANDTYYLGMMGACPVVVVKCEMGTTGRDAAFAVCIDALQAWRPRAVIMVGIAFGKDPKRQNMCDVLVASHIIPYELAKLARNYVPRAPHPPTNALLFNRFVNATDWTFYRQGRSRVQIRIGPVLTGEKVVDNPRAKTRLFKLFPHAIGGEMEGAGLFAAAERRSTPWMLVKAICDWGDGTKNDKFQKRAAAAAASLVHHVLSEHGALDDLPTPACQNDANPFVPALSGLRLSSPPRVEVFAQETHRMAVSAEASGDLVAAAPSRIAPIAFRPPKADPIKRPKRSRARPNLVLLTAEDLGALWLLATAPAPLPSIALAALFPRIKWKTALRSLRRKGLIETNDPEFVTIARAVKRSIFESRMRDRYEERWLRSLEALRAHTDTAVLLALLHLRAQRYEEAVRALTDIAEALEPGHNNAFYRSLLADFMDPRILKKISSEARIHLFNAFGLCLAREGDYVKSLEVYARLLSASRTAGNTWGIGQAYINSGVSHFHLGNLTKAQRCYRIAARHGKRARNPSLEGRALNNLGLIVSEKTPGQGALIIAKALKLKLACGDITGVAGTLMGQGNLHSRAGRHTEALARYSEAEELARRLEMRHLRGLALTNMGSAHVDLGNPSKAVLLYEPARQIAKQEGFQDVRRFATQGAAVAHSRMKHFRLAMVLFLELADLKKADVNVRGVLSALHDAGVMAVLAGNRKHATLALKKALRLAIRHGYEQWIFRCRLALAEGSAGAGLEVISDRLSRAAIQVSAGGHHEAASRLWLATLDRAVQSKLDASKIDRMGRSALAECARSESPTYLIEVYKRLCVWRRDRNDFEVALEYAKKIEELARSTGHAFDRITAIDEQACCHQRLKNPKLAERLHRKALALAERAGDNSALASPAVNLAALLRNTGNLTESRELLRRADRIAAATSDVPLAAMVAGTTALVLADEGKPAAARNLLESWARKTATLKMWPEHVLALHRLANLAFTQKQLQRADSLYRKALAAATVHNDDTQHDIARNFALLLTERMRESLRRGRSQVAGRAFERARALTKQYSLKESYRSLLLALGASLWRLGPRHYLKGTQAYLAAFMEIPDVGIEEALHLNAVDGAALVLHFHGIPQSQSLAKVENLVQRSREWLRKQDDGGLTEALETFLCWPLVAGVRVATLVRSSQAPDAETVSKLAISGFKEAVAKLQGDAA